MPLDRRPLADTPLALTHDRLPQITLGNDTREPSPGSRAALVADNEKLKAQLARLEADNARLRSVAPLDLSGETLLSVTVPVLLVSEANARDHHHTKAKRVRSQRAAMDLAFGMWKPMGIRLDLCAILSNGGHLSVHLVRRASRLLDDDNLAGSGKGVRDAIAAWLKVDDGPRGPVVWSYSQEAHRRWDRTPEVLVEIRRAV